MLTIGEIPETLETDPGECLEARTRSLGGFRTLGAHDLVQLAKVTKSGKESSTWHYVSGVDVSSSASVAAHINTLTFTLGETQAWLGRHPQWRIASGTYCTWNVLSRVDLRVNVNIPGSVEAYAVDAAGDRQPLSEDYWLEAYMSGMVRSLLLVDADVYFVPCARHEDPLPARRAVQTFLEAFEKLFARGPLLGAAPQVHASLDKNYMVDALFAALRLAPLYDEARAVLTRLAEDAPEARVLLAQLDLLADNETGAVRGLLAAVREDARDAHALVLEADFALGKKSLDIALDTALRAVAAAPGEFYAWEVLTKVYIARGQYDMALLTLNSCPLVPSAHIDGTRMPAGKKVNSPLPQDGVIDEIWDVDAAVDTESADPALLRLPAAAIRGPSKAAYDLLALIYSKTGWAKMMAIRGDVFLMEVEAAGPSKRTRKGTVGAADAAAEVPADGADGAAAAPSDGEIAAPAPAEQGPEEADGAEAAADQSANGANGTANDSQADAQAGRRSIRSKRICERRLDLLFLYLFDDVRTYSNWQREAVHFESQQLPYVKTALEWEILGAVAHRLGHDDEAQDALTRSLNIKFSHRPTETLLDIVAPAGGRIASVPDALDYAVSLMAWNHRWYREFSPRVEGVLKEGVALEGLTKVRNRLEAAYSKTGAMKIVNIVLNKFADLKVPGSEL